MLVTAQDSHAISFRIASVLGLQRWRRLSHAGDVVIFDPVAIDYLPAPLVSDLPGKCLTRDARAPHRPRQRAGRRRPHRDR
jgi:hypothetical protein